MGSLGFPELLVILFIVLLIFGANYFLRAKLDYTEPTGLADPPASNCVSGKCTRCYASTKSV